VSGAISLQAPLPAPPEAGGGGVGGGGRGWGGTRAPALPEPRGARRRPDNNAITKRRKGNTAPIRHRQGAIHGRAQGGFATDHQAKKSISLEVQRALAAWSTSTPELSAAPSYTRAGRCRGLTAEVSNPASAEWSERRLKGVFHRGANARLKTT